MIQPISLYTNSQNYKRNLPVFKNSTALESRTAIQSTVNSGDLIKYLDTKEKQDKKEKQSQLLTIALLSVATIGAMFLLPKVVKSGKETMTRDIADNFSPGFESLKDNKNIPTLDTCKSINKKLKNFLQNQVDFANASQEDLIKTGKPQSANRLLMLGKPGSGKSFFAKIFAKTIDAEYMEIKYSDLNKQYCGEHIENMKKIFGDIITTAQCAPNKKFVVNFNEIDALANPIEVLDGTGSHSVFKKEERTVFLIFLEETAEKVPNVIITGSSNSSPKGIDGALASRFQNIVEVPYPNKEELFEALKANIETLPEGKSFIEKNYKKIEEYAEKMHNRQASFRDLNSIVNESKNIYLRNLIKDKNSSYKIDYIDEALKTLDLTDGEISKLKT